MTVEPSRCFMNSIELWSSQMFVVLDKDWIAKLKVLRKKRDDDRAKQEQRERDKQSYVEQGIAKLRAWERKISGRQH